MRRHDGRNPKASSAGKSNVYRLPTWAALSLMVLVCGLPLAAQSTATTEFCNWQQAAFLNANMNNPALALDKLLHVLTCQSMLNQDTMEAQIQKLQAVVSPTTFGSTATAGTSDGGDTNVEFLTPFTTGLVPSTVASCSLYAATGSSVTGKFGCTLRDANGNLLCSTTADATTATVPGWNSNANFSGCAQLTPLTHYMFGFHKTPYGAVLAVENNNGPQSGFMASGLNEPPYPATLSGLTPSFQMSAYLTVTPIQ